MQLTTAQKNAISRFARQFDQLGGGSFADFMQENILDEIEAGNIGIAANAWDVDAVAAANGAFAFDPDNTAGLNFGLMPGRIRNGSSIVEVAASVTALTASNTNYVEVTVAGAVSRNVAGFTAGSIPLYIVTTGAATITAVENFMSLLFGVPAAGWSGAQLTTAAKTKELSQQLGTINATKTFPVIAPNHAATLSAFSLALLTTVNADDANYWTVTLTNKGAAGAGNTAMLAASDANTTKATGGSAITANVTRAFTLHGTGANLIVAAHDLILVTFTKTGAAGDLVTAEIQPEFTFAN
jgi:hypothetical protein